MKIKIKIKKGRHYPFPYFFTALPICVNKNNITTISADFMFTESCLYDLKDEDQHDVNKLIGFSIGHHQKGSSFRFGWRPILSKNKIEIVGYEYHDGVRQKTMPIGLVGINTWKYCEINYFPKTRTGQKTYYLFGEHDYTNKFNINKKSGLGYTLGVYFGGNEKAPQDIIIHKMT